MFSMIIETIFGALAEFFAGKAVEKGMQKAGKARGWITLAVLVLLVGLLIWLGVYLIQSGVAAIAILMFAIAAFILGVTLYAGIRNRKRKKQA